MRLNIQRVSDSYLFKWLFIIIDLSVRLNIHFK